MKRTIKKLWRLGMLYLVSLYLLRGCSPVLCMMALLSFVALAAAPAEAAQPEILKMPADFTDTFDTCGFTVEHHVEGHLTIHIFFDKNGNPRFQVNTFAFTESFTNPVNGMSITTRNVGPDKITFNEDGTVTVATIGLLSHVIVKGQGETAALVGKIVFTFDAEGNLIGTSFEAGKHEDLLPAICAALS